MVIWLIVVIILLYLATGTTFFFQDLFKGASSTASLRNAARKLGIRGLLWMLWLTAPGYILFWGLGEKLRERLSEWLFRIIAGKNRS
ncbi:MAG: hypothetical protein IPG53_20775 [Ignavibacteriales bacterium]|nr:hypothetical protein [Ignavibacteriales bacterium]